MAGMTENKQIQVIFSGYRRSNVAIAFPLAGVMSELLNKETAKAKAASHDTFSANPVLLRMFASAAVEMWHRAVHSFIISAGLYSTSPLWSSVSGYYSSHYVMRGYAHLLGRYLLYREKRVVTLLARDGGFVCFLDKKGASDREHKAYWKFVRTSTEFGSDPFFNVEVDIIPRSDGAHRTKANYSDHLGEYSVFKALTKQAIVDRINRISDIEITAVPIPNADSYPDLESVQIMAYHRIVRFRSYLDKLLGKENRFWNAHRTPQWCENLLDFQVAEPQFLPAVTTS